MNPNYSATYEAIRLRIRDIALIKGVLALVILVIMVLTFRHTVPLLVALADLILVPIYVILGKRYPRLATYLLVVETTLAFTPRQFVQGYVNGINWLFYIPLPLAAAYVIGTRQALLRATVIVTLIAAPIMLLASLTLDTHIEKTEIFTLLIYVLVVLWGVTWLASRFVTREQN